MIDFRKKLKEWYPNPIDQWEKDGKLYFVNVIENPESEFKFVIDYAGIDEGGAHPFKTKEDLEAFVAKHKLRNEQLSLF